MFIDKFLLRHFNTTLVELLAHIVRDSGSILALGVVGVNFTCSPYDCVCFPWLLRFPPRSQRRAET